MTHENNDDGLESLFDQLSTQYSESLSVKTAEVEVSIVAESSIEPTVAVTGIDASVISAIGRMTRSLHDSLHDLGLDVNIEQAAASIPDARDRLNYVATLTQQAATKVLNATDTAMPVVERIGADAKALSDEFDSLFNGEMDSKAFVSLMERTRAHLASEQLKTKEINGSLMEIMMAQDFQDLTGQVIKKVIDVTQSMEQQLLSLLVENATPVKFKPEVGLLNGPVINAEGRDDVVTNQDEVDDLLESLGF